MFRFKKGDRVRLTNLAKERHIDRRRDQNRLGTIFHEPTSYATVAIKWDDCKGPQVYNSLFIETVEDDTNL